jgi:lipoprotein NlpD
MIAHTEQLTHIMSMHKKIPLVLLVISLGLLSACSTTSTQAPVIERAPERVIALEPGMYLVKKGDTLIRIALEHGQSQHDLAAWNRLANPNDIKVDQVLRVVAPDSGSGSGGAQTSAVTMPPETTTPAVPKKSTPRGDKRPYSEAALAELQRPEGGAKPDAPAPVAARPAPPAAVAPVPGAGDEKLSWMWPSAGKVIGTFDEGKNKGIDIAGKAGQQVIAAGAGKVMYAGSGIRGYGNLVIVKHSSSLLSAYAHNRSIVVKEGQSVSKGQMIAEMGDSDSDAVKLHFEIRQQGKPVDPSKFLPSR